MAEPRYSVPAQLGRMTQGPTTLPPHSRQPKDMEELRAFVATLRIGDRIEVEWMLPGTSTMISWSGLVKATSERTALIAYDGQGPD
ncbi:MAG: hypothetical protein ACRDF4_11510, partial [Rhabdochlamydiaceae bacterium]